MPKKLTPEEVKDKVSAKHGNTYGYESVDFSVLDDKQPINCTIHGEFRQTLRPHLRGKGCPSCGREITHKSKRSSAEEFKLKAIDVHDNKYDYSKVKYKNSASKVVIICDKHGEFEQDPHSHLKGSGCPSCANTHRKLKVSLNGSTGWSYSDWEKQGSKSENFKGFSLYVIECISSKERFIKVGKTFTDIGLRFKNLPYKFKVLTQVYYNAYAISQLETKLHKKLKEFKYTPSRDFNGKTECYSLEAKELSVLLAEE